MSSKMLLEKNKTQAKQIRELKKALYAIISCKRTHIMRRDGAGTYIYLTPGEELNAALELTYSVLVRRKTKVAKKVKAACKRSSTRS